MGAIFPRAFALGCSISPLTGLRKALRHDEDFISELLLRTLGELCLSYARRGAPCGHPAMGRQSPRRPCPDGAGDGGIAPPLLILDRLQFVSYNCSVCLWWGTPAGARFELAPSVVMAAKGARAQRLARTSAPRVRDLRLLSLLRSAIQDGTGRKGARGLERKTVARSPDESRGPHNRRSALLAGAFRQPSTFASWAVECGPVEARVSIG